MEDLGRNKRITGLGSSHAPEPETVSAPLPRADSAAWDPDFEGDVPFDRERAAREAAHVHPDEHAHITDEGARAALAADERLEQELAPRQPKHAAPMRPQDREPFVRQPVPHRTQPAVNLMNEDDSEGAVDYTHESDFTTRRGSMLSGGGYRRSRNDEKRFKKDLKYGQYLEVPKGRRDLFASKTQVRNRKLAVLALVVIAAALVVWAVMALAGR